MLGNGELTKALTVEASIFSASAKEKIETAGGKAEGDQSRRRGDDCRPQGQAQQIQRRDQSPDCRKERQGQKT